MDLNIDYARACAGEVNRGISRQPLTSVETFAVLSNYHYSGYKLLKLTRPRYSMLVQVGNNG
jgi:hypothetical protein